MFTTCPPLHLPSTISHCYYYFPSATCHCLPKKARVKFSLSTFLTFRDVPNPKTTCDDCKYHNQCR